MDQKAQKGRAFDCPVTISIDRRYENGVVTISRKVEITADTALDSIIKVTGLDKACEIYMDETGIGTEDFWRMAAQMARDAQPSGVESKCL